MNARDRGVYQVLLTFLAMVAALVLYEALVPALRHMHSVSVPLLVLLVPATLLVRAGHRDLGGWVLVGPGAAVISYLVVTGGGAASPMAGALPVAAVNTWFLVGRRGGVFVMTALCGALVASLAHPPSAMLGRGAAAFVHLASIVGVFGFTVRVLHELRSTVEATAQRAAEAEQDAALADASHHARERFLAEVSHELRTPLDAILGYTELLVEEEIEPERIQDLHRIRAAGAQLLRLVDDILDLSRALTEDLRLESAPIDVAALLHDVVETARPLALANGDRLAVELDADTFPLVSDRARVRQVLLNLVSNAIKYTNDGVVTVEARTVDDWVEFVVSDTGVGIPEDKLHQLFQPFVQLHEGTERRAGIGLGLALSQGLAERLGGRISASSVVGSGSVFTLRLPRPVPEARASGSLWRRATHTPAAAREG
jgi:signal transduction histidine kinase